jgi:ATP-dependent Clp protease ATP-binding subunit ClpA
VLLVGPQGIGKGALIQNVASEIGMGTFPIDLKVFELDLSKFTGVSAQMAGQPNDEAPIDKFFNKVLPSLSGKAVIVVKGLDQVLGPAGAGNNFLDKMRRLIENGQVQFLFSLNPSTEHLLAPDHFLRKHAKVVAVREPKEGEALSMMLAHKTHWESTYGIEILDSALETLVATAKEFLRRLSPMELVDIMEEALRRKQPQSQKDTAQIALSDTLFELTQAIAKYRRTASAQDYNKAAALIQAAGLIHEKLNGAGDTNLGPTEIKELMAQIYDNPMITKNVDFKQRILAAVPKIRGRMVGQDEAVNAVLMAEREPTLKGDLRKLMKKIR